MCVCVCVCVCVYYEGFCGVMVIIVGNEYSKPEFKSWMRLFAFPIVLIPLGIICIQVFSFQL